MKKQEKENINLNGNKRDIVGKKVKKLRAEGKIPANIFGEGFKSQSIWVAISDFLKVYKSAGETQVVYLTVDNNEYPTVIDGIQKHPLTGDLLHIDFKKISLKKKIETEVPAVLVGESEAVAKKRGDLLTFKDVLMVSGLPNAIPTQIDVDITTLVEVDDEITVAQLQKSGDYEFIDAPETVIVKISAHKEESVEPDTSSTMPEITEEATPDESGDASESEAEAEPTKESE